MALFQTISPLVAALALCSAALAPDARALTVDPAPLDVLVLEAALGLRGVVASVTPERVPGHPRRVRSRVLVLIDEPLWARDDRAAAQAALGVVELVLPGGTLGGYTTRVPGVPLLRPGDRARFLLEAVGGEWMPLGYSLGILPVDEGAPGPGHAPPRVAP